MKDEYGNDNELGIGHWLVKLLKTLDGESIRRIELTTGMKVAATIKARTAVQRLVLSLCSSRAERTSDGYIVECTTIFHISIDDLAPKGATYSLTRTASIGVCDRNFWPPAL